MHSIFHSAVVFCCDKWMLNVCSFSSFLFRVYSPQVINVCGTWNSELNWWQMYTVHSLWEVEKTKQQQHSNTIYTKKKKRKKNKSAEKKWYDKWTAISDFTQSIILNVIRILFLCLGIQHFDWNIGQLNVMLFEFVYACMCPCISYLNAVSMPIFLHGQNAKTQTRCIMCTLALYAHNFD